MRDEIDRCKWLFLREIGEPEENTLRVVVEEAKSGEAQDIDIGETIISGASLIESDESCRLFELIWPTYVSYAVRNESFTSWDDTEVWEGQSLRVYSKSSFKDYVARATFASDSFPGPMKHWCVVCLRHIVDVIGTAEPEYRQLRESQKS